MQFYEDIAIGHKQAFGRYEVTREEVIDFASKYDPQPFHLDDEAAAQTHFGRISASGCHTCAMTMTTLGANPPKPKPSGPASPGAPSPRATHPVFASEACRPRVPRAPPACDW